MENHKVEVSYKTIVFFVLFVLSLGFVYYLRDIVLQFFVAILLATSFNPPVKILMRRFRLTRSIASILIYLLIFGVFGGMVFALLPIVIEQTTAFVNNFPNLLDKLGVPMFFGEKILPELLSSLGSIPGRVAKAIVSIFSNVVSVFSVVVFSFYLLIARDKLETQLAGFFGEGKTRKILRIVGILENKLGSWARGELVLMVVIGTATYIGLSFLAIPYALPLSILAGLLEIVPILGPFIAAIPPVIIGFGISPVTGIATASLNFLIQQMENYILVPRVMEKSAGVSPVVTLLALSMGFKLMGIIGALLSVPIVICLKILLQEYYIRK